MEKARPAIVLETAHEHDYWAWRARAVMPNGKVLEVIMGGIEEAWAGVSALIDAEEAKPMDGFDVISTYSRAQAIEDGVLIDVSLLEPARTMFKFPVAVTAALHAELTRGRGEDVAIYAERLRDVFMAGIYATRRMAKDASDVFFNVKVGGRLLALWSNCGPGDNAEPVITFGFPEDR